MRNIVVLDYGHGWDTPGKRSPDGELMEGRWSRDVGPRIAKALREVGLDVVEIINSKDDIPLKERCARVNDVVRKNPHDNIIFVSIHVDAAPGEGWSKASGMSVWVSPHASEQSVRLGQLYTESAQELNLLGDRCVPKERVWKANYQVLRGTQCPAVLIEDLFMTNQQEVKFLLSEKGKETIVNLHLMSICKYFGIPCSLIQ